MSTNGQQQAVFTKVFADGIDDEILTAVHRLKTTQEKKAVMMMIDWIEGNRGRNSNFMLTSTVNRGVEIAEERKYHNLFTGQ